MNTIFTNCILKIALVNPTIIIYVCQILNIKIERIIHNISIY